MSRARTSGEEDWFWRQPPVTATLRDAPQRFAPGDALILNGPARGGWADGLPRRPWVVVECACGLCEAGGHVAVDVPQSDAMLELYPESGLWRHLASVSLRRRGELSRGQAEAWADELASPRVGQAFGQCGEEPGEAQTVRTLRSEFAALALFDALGGGELTDEQAHALDWWREQTGGEHTPEQVEQLRAWQRERGMETASMRVRQRLKNFAPKTIMGVDADVDVEQVKQNRKLRRLVAKVDRKKAKRADA